MNQESFNYNNIPLGYYDDIARLKKGMRSFWHNQKFDRIIAGLPENMDSLLDFGCFSGTFLSLISEDKCLRQVGVDILKQQIDYANEKYGTSFRSFLHINNISELDIYSNQFSYATIIEVIEHLTKEEILNIFNKIYTLLKPGGKLVLSTPNYVSAWPFLELILNKVSDVKYEEQHITKFNLFNFERKLKRIIPDIDKKFKIEYKTTSHFLSPYIALLSYKLAQKLSGMVKSRKWKFPFGSIVIVEMVKISG